MSTPVETSFKAKLFEIAKHTSVYSLASIAQTAVSFLLLPLYMKFFSPAEYGTYSLLLMINSIGTAVFYLGINSALPTSYFEKEDSTYRQRIFSTALFLAAAGSVLFVVLAAVFNSVLSRFLFEGQDERTRIMAICVTGAFIILNQLFLTLFRILRKTSFVAFSGLIGVFVTLLSTYYLVAIQKWGIDAPILSALVVQAATFVVYLAAARKSIVASFDRSHARIMLKFGFPTILISFGVMTVEWSDRIILQKLLTAADVGVYSLGFRVGAIVTPLLITPLAQVWNPMAFEHRARGDYATFSGRLITVYSAIGLIVVLGAQLFAFDTFKLLFRAPAYQNCAVFVPFIVAGAFLNGLNNFVTMGAIFERKLKWLVINSYFLAALSASLNYLLISKIGTIGAATTYAVVNVLSPVLAYQYAKRFQKIDFEFNRLMVLAGLTLAFLLGSIAIPWPGSGWVMVIKVLYFAPYVAFTVKILRKDLQLLTKRQL